jgi:hypothetical protein
MKKINIIEKIRNNSIDVFFLFTNMIKLEEKYDSSIIKADMVCLRRKRMLKYIYRICEI